MSDEKREFVGISCADLDKMTFKHEPFTHGPWTIEENRGQESSVIGEPIAVVGGEATGEGVEFTIGKTCDFGPHGDAQTKANALLVAAAPTLLEACEAALKHMSNLWGANHDSPVRKQIEDAIDRARGRGVRIY